MPEIKVVTDSAAGLDLETQQDLDVRVVPLRVQLGDTHFREGSDIEPDSFLRKLAATTRLPVLSPPSVEELSEIYRELSESCEEILSIHVSSRLCDVARIARQASQEFLGRCRITVIDSMVISHGQALLVAEGVRASQEGLTPDQAVRLVRGMIPRIYGIFFTEDLRYLEQGGRIGQAQTILGSMLGIKPVLTLEDGDILPLEKVRSTEKALDKLVEFVSEFSQIEDIAILQSQYTNDTLALLELLDSALPGKEIPVYTYGPSLAVHIGPTGMGILVFEKN